MSPPLVCEFESPSPFQKEPRADHGLDFYLDDPFVAANKAEAYEWYKSGNLPLLAITINAALGLTVIVTYLRFLKELDGMQQKIQLNALALAMGVGLVGSVTYSLLISAGFVAAPDIAVVIMLLGGDYSAGLVIGRARYQ